MKIGKCAGNTTDELPKYCKIVENKSDTTAIALKNFKLDGTVSTPPLGYCTSVPDMEMTAVVVCSMI